MTMTVCSTPLENYIGVKVAIYYNLHKHTFSVKAMEGEMKNKVVGYSDTLILSPTNREVVFKVSEAGRRRVLATKNKNVHAVVVGVLTSVNVLTGDNVLTSVNVLTNINGLSECSVISPTREVKQEITYSPYHHYSFVVKACGTPIYTTQSRVLFDNKRVFLLDGIFRKVG